MQSFNSSLKKNNDLKEIPAFYLLALTTLLAGLFFSRALLSISIVLLLITRIEYLRTKPLFRSKFSFFLFPFSFFVLAFFSFLFSSVSKESLHLTLTKCLFVAVPFILYSLRNISIKQIAYLYHFFLLFCFIGICYSLFLTYSGDIEISNYYKRGWVIPTIVHHIRFSLFCAFSAVFCCFIFFNPSSKLRQLNPAFYIVFGTFFIVYLHFLAVRSGLIGFYLAFVFLLFTFLFSNNSLQKKLLTVSFVSLIVFGAFVSFPSLKQKVNYTAYSLKKFKNNDKDVGLYSDSRRLISYKAAISIIKENPFFGSGVGNIKEDLNKYYLTNYPNVDQKNLHPHNQYLYTASTIGIPAAFLLLLFNLYLLVYYFFKKNWLLVAFNVILIFSFLVENTLEMQLGVTFYFFFNYLGLKDDNT